MTFETSTLILTPRDNEKVNAQNRRGGRARLIRYFPVCGLQELAEKKSVSAAASALLFPSSIERSNPLSPDFFHNLQKRVRSVRHGRHWFCFSSTSFLTFHKKPAPKKIENQEKNPIPTSIFRKTKNSHPPDLSLEKRPSTFFHSRSHPDARKKSTEALSQFSFFVYRRSSPRTVILPAQSHNLFI